ncbi:Zinc finger protein JAGGED [Zea mays]|uniref:Zinc finger protein JAGGED n=1 Tax=Zea mays TaxID=4577 RepID=A0A1D6FDU0_MAIZE|nr:Zinc finger protein JAGGED [Zea mays]
MRQDGSPLDLNNLPEEYGKQAAESSTTTATSSVHAVIRPKKTKSGRGKDAAAKVYECRFCSLKFGKSQALERETETLNRARQLVFGNESLAVAAVGAQMSFRDVNMAGAAPPTVLGVGGNFRGGAAGGGSIGDLCVPFRPVLSPQPSYHYLYTAPSTLHPMSYPATYPGPLRQPAVDDYIIGHAVSAGGDTLMQSTHRGSFSCFGAPLTAPPVAATNVQADKVICNCSFT